MILADDGVRVPIPGLKRKNDNVDRGIDLLIS